MFTNYSDLDLENLEKELMEKLEAVQFEMKDRKSKSNPFQVRVISYGRNVDNKNKKYNAGFKKFQEYVNKLRIGTSLIYNGSFIEQTSSGEKFLGGFEQGRSQGDLYFLSKILKNEFTSTLPEEEFNLSKLLISVFQKYLTSNNYIADDSWYDFLNHLGCELENGNLNYNFDKFEYGNKILQLNNAHHVLVMYEIRN